MYIISLNRKIRFKYRPQPAFKSTTVVYTFKFVQSLFYNYGVVQFSSNTYTETRIDVLIYTNVNVDTDKIKWNRHNNVAFATEEDHNGIYYSGNVKLLIKDGSFLGKHNKTSQRHHDILCWQKLLVLTFLQSNYLLVYILLSFSENKCRIIYYDWNIKCIISFMYNFNKHFNHDGTVVILRRTLTFMVYVQLREEISACAITYV